jgi:uncharacterized protein (DUF2147 family)
MYKSFSTAALVFAALASVSAPAQSVQNVNGIWRAEDGSASVRVAKCPASANWCATVIEERLAPGDKSALNQMIVREMRPKGGNAWTGEYVAGDQTFKATAKLSGPDKLAFKVCAFAFLCDTIRLSRVRS